MSTGPRCYDCRYWRGEGVKERGPHGRCHRYPPVVTARYPSGTLPRTLSTHWCGEFQAHIAAGREDGELVDTVGIAPPVPARRQAAPGPPVPTRPVATSALDVFQDRGRAAIPTKRVDPPPTPSSSAASLEGEAREQSIERGVEAYRRRHPAATYAQARLAVERLLRTEPTPAADQAARKGYLDFDD